LHARLPLLVARHQPKVKDLVAIQTRETNCFTSYAAENDPTAGRRGFPVRKERDDRADNWSLIWASGQELTYSK
jgi:hypothetical protein